MRGKRGRMLSLAAVLLGALMVTISGQTSRPPGRAAPAALAGWRADFNGDGTVDFCQIENRPGYSGLTCTVNDQPIRSQNIDLGSPEGRAFVDFDGDRRQDFCRVAGTGSNGFASCTLSEGKSFGDTLTSKGLDVGYADTRQWRDVNGDGRADFCRAVGTSRELFSCTLSEGRRGFGRTVNSRR
jgi:hypothetical protein